MTPAPNAVYIGEQLAYTGTTTIQGGITNLALTNALSEATPIIMTGGILEFNGAYSLTKPSTISLQGGTLGGSGTANYGLGITETTVPYDMQSGTVYMPLGGGGGLNKTSDGTLTLGGSNSYTGATDINDGTLSLANSAALAGAATSPSAAARCSSPPAIRGLRQCRQQQRPDRDRHQQPERDLRQRIGQFQHRRVVGESAWACWPWAAATALRAARRSTAAC